MTGRTQEFLARTNEGQLLDVRLRDDWKARVQNGHMTVGPNTSGASNVKGKFRKEESLDSCLTVDTDFGKIQINYGGIRNIDAYSAHERYRI